MALPAQSMFVAADLDTYVALLNEECPIEYKDSWAVNALLTDADTVYVQVQTPSSLAGFLPQLTGEGDNVKRMWIKQLKPFGHPWEEFFDRMAGAGRYLVISFHPKDARKTAAIVFTPDDCKALLVTPEESQAPHETPEEVKAKLDSTKDIKVNTDTPEN